MTVYKSNKNNNQHMLEILELNNSVEIYQFMAVMNITKSSALKLFKILLYTDYYFNDYNYNFFFILIHKKFNQKIFNNII